LKGKYIKKRSKRDIEGGSAMMHRGGATGWCAGLTQNVDIGTGLRNIAVELIAKLHNFLKKDETPALPLHHNPTHPTS